MKIGYNMHTAAFSRSLIDGFLFVFLTVVVLIYISLITKIQIVWTANEERPLGFDLYIFQISRAARKMCWRSSLGWCPLMRSILSGKHHPYSNQCLIEQCAVVWVLHWEEFIEALSLICEVGYYRGEN